MQVFGRFQCLIRWKMLSRCWKKNRKNPVSVMLKSTVWQASSSATALVMFRIRNLSIAPSKGSLQIIMQLRKSLQRSNTVKLFCYLISRRITCGTLFAQGFAKTKQTWKSSNRSWGTRTSKRLWMSTLKRLSRKSRNLLKDWLQNWTFFNRWRSALMGRSKWQQNHWMTANWQQTKGNKSVVWGMFD